MSDGERQSTRRKAAESLSVVCDAPYCAGERTHMLVRCAPVPTPAARTLPRPRRMHHAILQRGQKMYSSGVRPIGKRPTAMENSSPAGRAMEPGTMPISPSKPTVGPRPLCDW